MITQVIRIVADYFFVNAQQIFKDLYYELCIVDFKRDL